MSRARQVSQLIGASNTHLVTTPATFSNTVAVATSGITYGDASVQTTAPSGFGFKNRIINGAMMIDQRNAGGSVPVSTTSSTYSVDRWMSQNTQASKVTLQQNAGAVTPPVGFANYAGITSNSAYTVLSSDFFLYSQAIEANNFADFGWGGSNASAATLSFWVRSSLTGTFGGSLENGTDRSFPFSFTINAANTWEQKTISISAPAAGGTWGTGNGIGVYVRFGLGVGSTYSGTAGSWASSRYFSTTGATSVVGTSGATFYITGVQLEKGSTATSFDYRPYGTELALCQRYAVLLGTVYGGYTITVGRGMSDGGTNGWRTQLQVPGAMRGVPQVTAVNMTGWAVGQTVRTLTSIGTVYLTNGICLEVDLGYSGAVGAAAGQVYLQTNGSGGASYVLVSAEL